MNKIKLTLFLTIIIGIFASSLIAAAGDLDTSFGSGGRVTAIIPRLEGTYHASKSTFDKKTVVVSNYFVDASTSDPRVKIRLSKYAENGTLDTSFSNGGILEPIIRSQSTSEAVSDVILQPDGKIVIVGGTGNNLTFEFFIFLARFNPDGTSDGVFIGENIGLGGQIMDIKITSSGKFLVHYFDENLTYIRRWNNNLTNDGSFGNNGKIEVEGSLSEIEIQSDEKILISEVLETTPNTLLLRRYNSNGSVDTTFGSAGVASFSNGVATRPLGIGIQNTGKFVLCGEFSTDGINFIPHLIRFNSNGTLDTTFGTNGSSSFPNIIIGTLTFNAAELVVQTDNKLAHFGEFNGQPAVFRFTANGSLDTLFNSDGITTPYQPNTASSILSLSVQPDNKIVAVAEKTFTTFSDQGITVARLLTNPVHQFDFDGDAKDDYGVFRPSLGDWFINRSSAGLLLGFHWGIGGIDKLTPADFDGDGKTDIAVWRENIGLECQFFIFQSSNNTVRTELFGIQGDNPKMVGDWDGDGKADIAVYRGGDSIIAQSYFYYRGSLNNPNGNITFLPWGTRFDRAARGDFDGDGKQDAAVYRPSTRTWFILQSSNNTVKIEYFGLPTDKIINGDFDGDGKTDIAVVRQNTLLEWYILQSSNNQIIYRQWGLATDIPTPADYDGDGLTNVSVWRPTDATFYTLETNNFSGFQFGISSDNPISSAFTE